MHRNHFAANYSNTDIPGFFDTDTGWKKSQQTIYVLQHGTSAEWEIVRDEKSEVVVACFVDNNYRGACEELANHLHGYSLPFGCIFRVADHSESPGALHFESCDSTSSSPYNFVDLWVQGNVFVRIEEEGPHHDSASVRELAEKVHRHIQKGIVGSKFDAVVPRIVKIDVPSSVSVGTTFAAEVTLDNRYHKDVHCDSGVSQVMLQGS